MRLMKKAAALAMAAIMSAGVLSGCVGTGTEPKKETGSQETKAGETTGDKGEVAKPESIRWMVHNGLNEENGTDQWAVEFERLTGIKMNLEIISNNEYTQMLELSFASDTVPDVFDLTGVNLGVYAKQNAIADLTDLVKNSELYNEIDAETWDFISLDGKIYGIPMEKAAGSVTYIRKDWLDRLGMEVPTTYDEFIEMLRRFKNEIPECTVPITAPALKSSMNLPEFFQGATPEFIKVDGKWVDGMGQDNMYQALTNLRAAYEEGLLDSEVITNTTSNCRDQWYSGSVGVFNYWGGLWGQTLTERLKMNVPEAEVIAIKPIEGAVYESSVPSLLCISGKISEDRVASIFKYMVEYMHDGGEGQVLFQSGVEGIHWEQDGEYLKPLPTLSNPQETLKKAWMTPWLAIRPLDLTDKKMELAPEIEDSLKIVNEFNVAKNVYPVSPTLTKIKSDLELLKQEITAKVIMGDLTVEKGMERYKEEAKMLNVQKVEDEMNGK